jgi:hypothetical protein
VTPERRAKAIVEHFADMLPPAVRPQLESVITRAITRAVQQEPAKTRQRRPTHHNADAKPNHGQTLVGRTVTIRDSALHGTGNAYPLPAGLQDGQTVTVLAFDHGYFHLRDANGNEWRVYLVNIDSG